MLCASAAFAFDDDDSVVRWKSIAGVVTSRALMPPSQAPVLARLLGMSGSAALRVHRSNGATFFEVEGLTINSTNSSGTPGPVSAVTGTLVCLFSDSHAATVTSVLIQRRSNSKIFIAGLPQERF